MHYRKEAASARCRGAAGAAILALMLVLTGLDPTESIRTASAESASDAVAVVSRIAGQVDRHRDGSGTGLKVGDPVHSTDRIVTGADGRIRLQFKDGSTLVIGPGSDLAIASYDLHAAQNPGALLRLAQGILRLVVVTLPAQAGMTVEAPTAIAAVRGTAFIVEADPANTGVFVIDGSVMVESRETGLGGVRLHRDQGSDVAAGSAPTPPANWGRDRVVKVLQQTDFP